MYTVDRLTNGNVTIKNDGTNIDLSLPPSARLVISNNGLTVTAFKDKQALFGFTVSDIAAMQVEGVPITLPTTITELINTLSTSFFF